MELISDVSRIIAEKKPETVDDKGRVKTVVCRGMVRIIRVEEVFEEKGEFQLKGRKQGQ